LLKGAIALSVPVLSAVLLYFVGRYLSDRYQEQKKRAELSLLQASQSAQKQRELQLEAAARFYELYGEFFAVWKEWAAKAGKVMPAAAQRFRLDLYRRACVAEGHMEALLVRVVTEFSLDHDDVQTLGRFRQAYQTLREAIRADRDLGWDSSAHPGYAAFKRLAATVASLLARRTIPELPAPGESAAALAEVTDNKWESGWDK
jgi:hypothetical protein